MTPSDRVYRRLLLLYPRRFRERFTPELIDFFQSERARMGRAGSLRWVGWWLRTVLDLTRAALRMRFNARPLPSSPPPPRKRRGTIMEAFRQDIAYAIRGLTKRPGFTLVVVLTLALGIGANAAIFSVVRHVVLKPLPFADPDRLVMVWEYNQPREQPTNVVSPANYIVWRDLDHSPFAQLASIVQYSATLTGSGEAERVGLVNASPRLLHMLGLQPYRGRLLDDGDDVDDATVGMLSFEFWQRRFGSDDAVIGQVLTLNGEPMEVLGVLPPGFSFELPYTFDGTGTQDIWLPSQFDERAATARGRYLQVVGRLQDGVTIEQARSRMDALAIELEAQFPDAQTGWGINVVPLHEQRVGNVRTPLLVLFGAVGFVLLIACANVANLLLSRALGRRQEMALRSALGAGRGRVIQQLLTESSVLSLAGAAAGALVAIGTVRTLVAVGPASMPRLGEVQVDGSVLLFTLGLAGVTGILFGLVPAIRLSRVDLKESLADSGARGGTSRGHSRLRSGLVVAEVALSLMLLVGAGLLVRSFGQMQRVGVGFETGGMLTAQIQLPGRSYPTQELRVQKFEELVDRMQSSPGITEASAITFLPLAGSGSATSFWVNDRSIPREGEFPVADVRWIHRDYHRVMRLPLRAGRYFDEGDHANAPLRVVISENAAERLWPGESAIGRTISMPWGDTLVAEVIGVVGDVRHNGPTVEPRSMFYWDHRQFQSFNHMTLVLRTEANPVGLVSTVRAEVQAFDADLPIYNVGTMDGYFDDVVAEDRFAMLALGVFAAVAVLLAAIGIYGVISYAVNQRTREIGIKIALGAGGGAVERQVVRSALRLTGAALIVGIVGAVSLSRVMQGMVFEVSPTDPVTIAVVSAGLLAVSAVAAWIPARRASRIDPMHALRE